VFLVKVTKGRIQQRYYIVHPVTRSALTDLLTALVRLRRCGQS
jgi:hypothetical protein